MIVDQRNAARARRGKIFFSSAIFLPKTCCINRTNTYNYEQVMLDFSHFHFFNT